MGPRAQDQAKRRAVLRPELGKGVGVAVTCGLRQVDNASDLSLRVVAMAVLPGRAAAVRSISSSPRAGCHPETVPQRCCPSAEGRFLMDFFFYDVVFI